MRVVILAGVAGLAVWLVLPLEARRQPEFSGDWVLMGATTSGGTRGSSRDSDAARAVPTMVNTISGAAFNCGTACTITQTRQTLTVERAQLADYAGKDASRPTPAVMLHLDGRNVSVVDSFNPHLEIPVTASWQGDRLRIDSRKGTTARTQHLSLDDGQLVVVTRRLNNGEPRGETTFRYSPATPPAAR